MRLDHLIAGLQIFQKHFSDPEGYQTLAEHDVIYVYPTQTPLTDEEVDALWAMHWHQEYAKEGCYNPEDGWMAYT